jgi:hypothetical protein
MIKKSGLNTKNQQNNNINRFGNRDIIRKRLTERTAKKGMPKVQKQV